MSHHALTQLLYSDTHNTALCHALAPWLELRDLVVLAHVCRAFRSWPRDTGRQCFLSILPFWSVNVPVLATWKPHFLVDGVAHVSKRHSFLVHPRIYSCYARTVEGKQMVEQVPRGSLVDVRCTSVKARLVHAITHESVEELACVPLFQTVKPPKGEDAPYYTFRRPVFFKILRTLSSHYSPPCMFRLCVEVFVGLHDTGVSGHYTYTSDRFWVVSTAPEPQRKRVRVA